MDYIELWRADFFAWTVTVLYFAGVMRNLFTNDLDSADDTNHCASGTPKSNAKLLV